MSEYITKDKVYAILHADDELILFTRKHGEDQSIGERLCNAITRIPAADVEPVVRGEWKQDDWFDEDCNVYTCSACNESYTLLEGTPEQNLYNFCPNCGADMRKTAHMERSGSGE